MHLPLLVKLVHLVHEDWVSDLVEVLAVLHHLQLLRRQVAGVHLCLLLRLPLLKGVEDHRLSILKLQLPLEQELHLLLRELAILLRVRRFRAAEERAALVSIKAIWKRKVLLVHMLLLLLSSFEHRAAGVELVWLSLERLGLRVCLACDFSFDGETVTTLVWVRSLQQKLLRLAEYARFEVALGTFNFLVPGHHLVLLFGWALRFKFELVQQAEVNELLAFLSALLVSRQRPGSFTVEVLREPDLWRRQGLSHLNDVTSEFSVTAPSLCLKNRPFHVSLIFLLFNVFALAWQSFLSQGSGSLSSRNLRCTCTNHSWCDLVDLRSSFLGVTSRGMCVVEVKKRLLFIHQIQH